MDCAAPETYHWKVAFLVMLGILVLLALQVVSGYQVIHVSNSKYEINDFEQIKPEPTPVHATGFRPFVFAVQNDDNALAKPAV